MKVSNASLGELGEVIAYRRDRFGLVADVFTCESSEETLAHLIGRASDCADELDDSAEAKLCDGLQSLACDDFPVFATKTRTEYARLFLGPREVVAPLHESAYLSGTSRMFTAETLAVRAFYEQFGYTMKAKNREPEDSVGVELEFLRNLCERCLALLEGEDDACDAIGEVERLLNAQRTFKAQHLDRWVQTFAQRVVSHDESGYYVVWATFLIDMLNEDGALLDECLQLLTRVERSCSLS